MGRRGRAIFNPEWTLKASASDSALKLFLDGGRVGF